MWEGQRIVIGGTGECMHHILTCLHAPYPNNSHPQHHKNATPTIELMSVWVKNCPFPLLHPPWQYFSGYQYPNTSIGWVQSLDPWTLHHLSMATTLMMHKWNTSDARTLCQCHAWCQDAAQWITASVRISMDTFGVVGRATLASLGGLCCMDLGYSRPASLRYWWGYQIGLGWTWISECSGICPFWPW